MSKIEWTEQTWNPIAGCSVTSPGCKNCYAMQTAHRLARNPNPVIAAKYAGTTQVVNGKPVWTGAIGTGSEAEWTAPLRRRKPTTYFVNSMGDLFHPNVEDVLIDQVFAIMALSPQHRFQILTKYPERMRAWFAEFDRDINFESGGSWPEIDRIRHRVECDDNPHASDNYHAETARLEAALYDDTWPLPNVWLGVSVEDQTRADARIPLLLDTPAAVRFVSCEPLLGPVDLTWIGHDQDYDGVIDALIGRSWIEPSSSFEPTEVHTSYRYGKELCDRQLCQQTSKLDWVIVGGESGNGARPMHPDWARTIRYQCAAADVPFFFKQWGAWLPWEPADCILDWNSQSGQCLSGGVQSDDIIPWDQDKVDGDIYRAFRDNTEWAEPEVWMERVGKKAAGRTLDGVIHDAMPEVSS